jgi:hypothetical protein
MSDPVWRLPSNKVPSLGTENGIGTTLLHNSRPDAGGRFFATRWLMIVLPIAPLGRYYLRQGRSYDSGGLFTVRSTTEYEFHGRSRLRVSEVVRTYVFWWLVLPVVFVGPIIAGISWAEQQRPYPNAPDPPNMFRYELGGMLVAVLLTFLLLGLLLVYRMRWRPVREAHWVTDIGSGDLDEQ